jgi:hypothetical protein
MSIGSGTHFERPVLGSDASVGGLCEDVPIDIVARRLHFSYFNDFLTADEAAGMTATAIGAAAGTGSGIRTGDFLHGEVLNNAGTANSTGQQLQLTAATITGEFLDLSNDAMDGVAFAWEVRVKVDAVASGTLVIGMGEVDTTFVSTAGAITTDNGLFFRMADGGALTAHAERATNATVSGTLATMADDTYIRLGCRGRSADVSSATANQFAQFYVNGRLATTAVDATNGVIPNVGLCLSWAAVNDAANDIDSMLDYFWVSIGRA